MACYFAGGVLGRLDRVQVNAAPSPGRVTALWGRPALPLMLTYIGPSCAKHATPPPGHLLPCLCTADSFEKAVLANTNVGGENCHRGAALGAVMGAARGESGIPGHLLSGLADSGAIRREIDAYCTALHPDLVQAAEEAKTTCAAS